jgi:hypothetical protein
MVMFDVDAAQGGLLIDQVITVIPAVNPVTVVLAKVELVITPGPETFIQAPVPAAGTFPAIVATPLVAQIVWLGPAFAVVGTAFPTIIILSLVLAQGALDVVH